MCHSTYPYAVVGTSSPASSQGAGASTHSPTSPWPAREVGLAEQGHSALAEAASGLRLPARLVQSGS